LGVMAYGLFQFLRTHQGVSQSTLDLNEANTKAFMEWQFGAGQADWSLLKPTDIWSFCALLCSWSHACYRQVSTGLCPTILEIRHLKGACGPELCSGHSESGSWTSTPARDSDPAATMQTPGTVSDEQPQKENATTAMTLCMLDLGLRGGEVMGPAVAGY